MKRFRSPPPPFILYPELIMHKNIAFSTYKKFIDKENTYSRSYYTELAMINLKKNNRINFLRTTKTPVTYYFNDMGEFYHLHIPIYKFIKNKRIKLNSQFDQMMRDHGIIELMDYHKEENQDVINFCWSMVTSDPFPFKFAEQSLEADLREMKATVTND